MGLAALHLRGSDTLVTSSGPHLRPYGRYWHGRRDWLAVFVATFTLFHEGDAVAQFADHAAPKR